MKVLTNENYTLKIGASAAENNKLLTEAQPHDLWFHLEKFSSPHAILSGDEPPPTTVIYWAARETHAHSGKKSKYLRNVGVMYTPVKNVTKTDTLGSVTAKKYTVIKV